MDTKLVRKRLDVIQVERWEALLLAIALLNKAGSKCRVVEVRHDLGLLDSFRALIARSDGFFIGTVWKVCIEHHTGCENL